MTYCSIKTYAKKHGAIVISSFDTDIENYVTVFVINFTCFIWTELLLGVKTKIEIETCFLSVINFQGDVHLGSY